MRLSDLARWSAGTLVGADREAGRLVIDSRKVEAGDAFLALRGERFDGHDFLAQVEAAGAVGAVVEQVKPASLPQVKVADSRHALGLIAKNWCQRFPLRRIAVTGNAGKTSVKEMIACLLGEHTLATQGNLNNDIGVPLTLLRADDSHRYGVFELGANHAGEIRWTVSLVEPEVVLVTNVTGAHLEGFGSMQGIADAKAEIFTHVQPGARAILNLDDSFAGFFAGKAKAAGLSPVTISHEAAQTADFTGSRWREDDAGSHFHLRCVEGEFEVTLPLPGAHQLNNALQAIAAVSALGLEIAPRLPRLASLRPVAGRMICHRLARGVLVDDTYNANPGSVLAAGRWLAAQPQPQLFVFGGVGELGEQSAQLHEQMGRDLAAAGVQQLLTVGVRPVAALRGFGKGAAGVETHADALAAVREVLDAGGTVLVKGSRSTTMEVVVDAVLGRQAKNHGERH